MPIEQSFAIALVSWDCMAKGGSIPTYTYTNQI
jgi:hypothetical protein